MDNAGIFKRKIIFNLLLKAPAPFNSGGTALGSATQVAHCARRHCLRVKVVLFKVVRNWCCQVKVADVAFIVKRQEL